MGRKARKKVVTIHSLNEIDLDDMDDDRPIRVEEVELVVDEDGEDEGEARGDG